MALSDQQTGFQGWLIDSSSVAPPAVNNKKGLAIYHHAFRARLRQGLGETFEKTWLWLGDDAFDGAVAAYVRSHVPRHRSLDHYGDRFADFLRQHFADDLEISELAVIDWTLHLCFSGLDADPMDQDAFVACDWEKFVLRLVPTYTTHVLATNAASIWRALADQVPPPAAARLPSPVTYRFWRKAFSPHFTAMDVLEVRALDLVQKGLSFTAVCEALVNGASGSPPIAEIGCLLARWHDDSLIAAP
jgi:hypothetical protein